MQTMLRLHSCAPLPISAGNRYRIKFARLFLSSFSYCILLLVFLNVPRPGWAQTTEVVSPEPYQRTVNMTGFTRARQEITISSEVAGKCLAVYAREGELVPVSGAFAQVDDTFLQLDLKANRLEQEKIKRELAMEQRTLHRFTKLKELKAAAQAKVDQVTLSAALHELTLQDLQNWRARLMERLKRHTISAPANWRVIKRMIEPGEFIQPGTAVVTVGDFDQLVVPFSLSYKELLAVVNAPQLELKLPDLGIEVTAQLHTISPVFDRTTKKIPFELIIESAHPEVSTPIRGGVRAELNFSLPGEEGSFVVPPSAVTRRYDAHWVLKESGQRIKVRYLGSTDDGWAIIASPELTESDRLQKEILTPLQ